MIESGVDIARRAFEQMLGPVDGEPVRLAAGRTSEAWRLDLGGESWVARLLIPESGRRSSFRVEQRIGSLLAVEGVPVAEWSVVEVDGSECSVARMLPGAPIEGESRWSRELAADVAAALAATHALSASGWGPLADVDHELRGASVTATHGIVERWFHATIWPFDGTTLAAHPVSSLAPDVFDMALRKHAEILDASNAPFGVVHSDLHAEHLLVADGRLTGLLDFGDAFVGSTAWDIALLHWYYGEENTVAVVDAYPRADSTLLERGRTLALAVGLYKLAKNPADTRVIPRLRRLLGRAWWTDSAP